MSAPKRKGSGYERRLANELWDRGLAVLRGCSSGGGVRRRFVPDIVAVYGGRVVVIEVKYRSRPGTVRIDAEKISRILEFARRCGGEAYIAVKFRGSEWRFVRVDSPSEVVIRPEDLDGGLTLDQLVGRLKSRSLEGFLDGSVTPSKDH